MIIIGVTGTNGAGKGTVVDYLIKEKEFLHFSVRGFLIRELQKKSMENSRENMRVLANQIREEHHAAYIIEQLYLQAEKSQKNSVIESIRTTGEVNFLQAQDSFYFIAIDAKAETRYQRILKRGTSTDSVSFEEFTEAEKKEMKSVSNDKQNIAACISMADFKLMNDGSIKELHEKVSRVLEEIEKREIQQILRNFNPIS